jgi:hypothetical protein
MTRWEFPLNVADVAVQNLIDWKHPTTLDLITASVEFHGGYDAERDASPTVMIGWKRPNQPVLRSVAPRRRNAKFPAAPAR